MARAGLGEGWSCLLANDLDPKKARSYEVNWGSDALIVRDIADLRSNHMPGVADLAWASFPCQDLSLAGNGAGLNGKRSGTFWAFAQKIGLLKSENRNPKVLVLENVLGTLSSNQGNDFREIIRTLNTLGYRSGALVVDAIDFVPQSRPRLFVIAISDLAEPTVKNTASEPSPKWHPKSLVDAFASLDQDLQNSWVWWNPPMPGERHVLFSDLVEEEPTSTRWHSQEETHALIEMMSSVNLRKLRKAQELGRKIVGTIYKRTRIESGTKRQRAEVRFDQSAGCLRTPAGGSSRQLLIVVNGAEVRSRLISARETARLMGLPETYSLPDKYNDAYHLTGDGVVVPVVRHLAEHLIEPSLEGSDMAAGVAA